MKPICFWREFPLMVVLCVGGGVLVAGAVTFLMPGIHESGMIMEVRPFGSELEALKGHGSAESSEADEGSPEYLRKAAEDLRGRDMLGKVVNALQLDRKWKKDRKLAVEDLRDAVSVSLIRHSSLVSIRVRDVDRQDACAIATEIGWHFVELRNAVAKSELRQRLDQADRAIRDQEDRVEERRKVLRTIMRRSYEVDPNKVEWLMSNGSDTNEESPDDSIKRGGDPQTYKDAEKDLNADLRELATLSAKRAMIQMGGGIASETVVCHEMPKVAEGPVWPDVTFNLCVGVGLGLLLSPAMTLLMVRKKSRRMGSGQSRET